MSEEKKIECLRCGMCCMTADINWEKITEKNQVTVLDRLRWLSLHRCDTMVLTSTTGEKYGFLRIPLICRNLDQDKEGKYFCKDYANRPGTCRDFLCPRLKRGTPIKS